jgi:hypothetical protein
LPPPCTYQILNVATGASPEDPVTSGASEEDMTVADQQGGGKGYTNVYPTVSGSVPTVRRIVPEARGRVVFKVVYCVHESQDLSAFFAAVKSLNTNDDKVCFEVSGYSQQDLSIEAFRKDKSITRKTLEGIARDTVDFSNYIFIGASYGTVVEELAEKVVELITPLRDIVKTAKDDEEEFVQPLMPAQSSEDPFPSWYTDKFRELTDGCEANLCVLSYGWKGITDEKKRVWMPRRPTK